MKPISTLLLLLIAYASFAAAPTLPAKNLGFYTIDGNYFNLGWTAGNGARRIMVAKAGSEPTFVPQDGVQYTASTNFGDGQKVGEGEYIVYDHFSSSFFLMKLQPATNYYFRIYEYNGTGASTEYLTSSYLSGSGWTSSTPTIQSSSASFTNITANSVNINWTSGNGERCLIVAREGAPVNAEPTSAETYTGASYIFGNGTSLGNGNYAVYRSSSNYTSVTNLKPGTEYHFAFFEFNGNQLPQFLKPGYTASVTTRSAPTVAASGISISKTDGKELSLNWTNGNGQRRIVIAKQGSAVTAVPSNGTDYSASGTFGQGQQIAAGEYVVYDDNFHGATVSGLNPGTTYHFRVFEYDGTGSNTIYLTSSFAAVSGTTVVAPTVQTQFSPSTNLSSTSVRLNFAVGNGRGRFIIGRAGAPVNVNPADFSLYTEHTNFGSGQNMGNGNFAIAYTTTQAVTVQNLQPNTTYHFAVYEFNGYNQPLYLTPAATLNVTTTGVLPVKLLHWEATAAGSKVTLQWKTASEQNARHFVVERSADGNFFSPVATVAAAGNSAAERVYQAVDENPLAGKSYYRLKMVDLDEKTEYAAVRVVYNTATASVRILTNPVQAGLQVVSTSGNRIGWTIVNVSGQVSGKGFLSQGRNEINVSHLAPGRYWLQHNNGQETGTIPFIKQ